MSQVIEHTGRIQRIDGNRVQVLITQHSACSGCHAKAACTAADAAEKVIEAETDDATLQVGDTVTVCAQRSTGMLAVLLAFVIPFLLILLVLVALWAKDAIIVMIVLFVIATALSYVTSNWRKLQLRYARTTSLGSWTQVGRLHVAFCDDALHVEDKTGELATYPTSELRYVHETGDFVVAGFGRKRFVYVPRAALSENRWRELLRFLKDHR